MKNKIAILSPWYGSFPWYFPYFLHSCTQNDTIDFFIITDNKQQIANKPNNVTIVKMTLEELGSVASEKLDLKINIKYPYKLCDFKPTYGFLFPALLKGYDFWGYGDIDVIYGNLRHFLTDELLKNTDVFSFRPEYLSGSLTIFRNTEKINELFKVSKDYKTVFSRNEYFNFDECNFLFVPLWNGEAIESIPNEIESMTHIVKKKAKKAI